MNNQKGYILSITIILILLIVVIGTGSFLLAKAQVFNTKQVQKQEINQTSQQTSSFITQPTIAPTPLATIIKPSFNFVFKFGMDAKNELNTFDGTYTKDMIQDPPIKINISLDQQEMDSIYQKILEINLFDYPDKFSITPLPGEVTGMITPCPSYILNVKTDSQVKEISWDDCITNKNEKADKLRGLFKFIQSIIESKTELKQLPSPKGGYM